MRKSIVNEGIRKTAAKKKAKEVTNKVAKIYAKQTKTGSKAMVMTWGFNGGTARITKETVVLDVLIAMFIAGKVGNAAMPRVAVETVMLELMGRPECYPNAKASAERRVDRLKKQRPNTPVETSWKETLVSAIGYLYNLGVVEEYVQGYYVKLQEDIRLNGTQFSIWLVQQRHPLLRKPVPGIPAPKEEPRHEVDTQGSVQHVKVVTTLDAISALVGKTVLIAQAYSVEDLTEAFTKLLQGIGDDNALLVDKSDGRLSISIPMENDTPLIG